MILYQRRGQIFCLGIQECKCLGRIDRSGFLKDYSIMHFETIRLEEGPSLKESPHHTLELSSPQTGLLLQV